MVVSVFDWGVAGSDNKESVLTSDSGVSAVDVGDDNCAKAEVSSDEFDAGADGDSGSAVPIVTIVRFSAHAGLPCVVGITVSSTAASRAWLSTVPLERF